MCNDIMTDKGDRGPPVYLPPPHWGFFTVVIFEASEYGPIEIRLFAFKLLGLNMLKYANKAAITENPVSSNISEYIKL